jgi:predicted DNA-binding transcriptional regulator AlpA
VGLFFIDEHPDTDYDWLAHFMPLPRPERRLLTDKTAMERLGLSRSAFYRYLQKKAISEPVGKIAKNRRGWTDQDIDVAKSELSEAKRRGEVD